jgi:hypothetical protein
MAKSDILNKREINNTISTPKSKHLPKNRRKSVRITKKLKELNIEFLQFKESAVQVIETYPGFQNWK